MTTHNPLSAYFRAPKLQTRIPTMGKFYDESIIDYPSTGELPVMAMTAKDELVLKNPDALLNGEAVAQVIGSCVPCVKKPRQLISNDVDVLLVAIQAATYGDIIEVSAVDPLTNEKVTAHISAETALETIKELDHSYSFKTPDDLVITIKPFSYESTVNAGIANFKTTRSLESISQLTDDMDKLAAFNKNFVQMAELNFSLLVDAVNSIALPDGTVVTDTNNIREFLQNTDSTVGKKIDEMVAEVSKIGISHEVEFVGEEEGSVPFVAAVNFDPVGFFTASLQQANPKK